MLIQLKLKNIALIEIIEINFEKGLNIFTGDSGSGKSLILDSLNVLFGGTNIPTNHLIRPGKNECLIEALFESSKLVDNWLLKNGFLKNSSQICIQRKSFKKNNKIFTKYHLNKLPIGKKLIEDLGFLLIDFVGQSDNVLFSSYENRRSIIDDLGSQESKAINTKVKNQWTELDIMKKTINKQIELFNKEKENNFAVQNMFKILEEANLYSNHEILELESQETKLSNIFELKNTIKEILNNLNGFTDDYLSVSSLIGESIKKLNKVAHYDSKLELFNNNLIKIQSDVEDMIFSLSEYLDLGEQESSSLEEIQSRLFFLKNLQRTFSLDLPELIQKRDELSKKMTDFPNEEVICKLKTDINNLQKSLDNLFQIQSSKRSETALHLEKSVTHLLNNLGLKNAKFSIQLEKGNPSSEGFDNINFLFSANPGQRLAPLSKVISGGEMSRFLLALKSSISKNANTFFLDEIDSGLSGKSLFSLVELIKDISDKRQILCITHQPFLAAAAKVHFKVEKKVINGITYTSLLELITKEERHKELIELIGGGFNEANNYALTLIDRAVA